MLWYYGKFANHHLYVTEDVELLTEVEIEREYGATIRAAITDLENRRMLCSIIIITCYQVLVLPKPRFDLALTTIYQLPNRIGDTVVTGESPTKVC